jgi:hypothetical protein
VGPFGYHTSVLFLYACRRDFVRNLLASIFVSAHFDAFLYACWRDFVWNRLILRFRRKGIMFLYACRRDFVWNPTPCWRGWDQR